MTSIDFTVVVTESYVCAFCETPIKGDRCGSCGRIDGAIEAGEYAADRVRYGAELRVSA